MSIELKRLSHSAASAHHWFWLAIGRFGSVYQGPNADATTYDRRAEFLRVAIVKHLLSPCLVTARAPPAEPPAAS
jgi:hypothetical protein